MIVRLKKDDTKAILTDALTVDGVAVNLTGATVFFVMKNAAMAVKRTATITNAVGGLVSYNLGVVPADVATIGLFNQEWEVLFADLTKLSFPNNDYNVVHILGDLG